MNLVVAGTDQAVMMVESEANGLPEPTMIEAIELAHAEIKKIVAKVSELQRLVGREKRQVETEAIDSELEAGVKEIVAAPIREAIFIPNKTARQERLDEILQEAIQKLATEDPGS